LEENIMFKKLFGNGKTMASGIAAVVVVALAPVLASHGVVAPPGLEEAIVTILLVIMGVVGLGDRNARLDEKVDENVAQLKQEIEELKKK
jgi:hypothetical protein